MVNSEHLEMLQKGTNQWNNWRANHFTTIPDLRGVDLNNANLVGANLSTADLGNANLSGVDLSNANLFNAHLVGANLNYIDLSQANLNYAYLTGASLDGANLVGTSFECADLVGVDLTNARIRYANFSHASFGKTILGDINLRTAKGLETINHLGPSIVSIGTIYISEGRIPEVFLRGAGVPDHFIEYARSLVQHPIQYYTCFISYSSKDEDVAKRLYNDLQGNHIRCWFAPEDLKAGDRFHQRIEESIRLYDKLIVILSEHSVASTWVEREVKAAEEKEEQFKRQGQERTVLFPVRIDDAITQTNQAWAADLRRQRHIIDLTRWKDHDAYTTAFQRILRDLQA